MARSALTSWSAIVPGNPFSITEVFHIVSDGVNQTHLAGAIWVDPAVKWSRLSEQIFRIDK
jgi:hypothetical protein